MQGFGGSRAWPGATGWRVALAVAVLMTGVVAAQEAAPFDVWLAELRQEAADRGYAAATLEQAFSEIEAPVPRIVSNDRNQPERVQTFREYIDARVSDWRIGNGRQRLESHGALLDEVAAEHGVQARFILAIWGMETNFGTYPISENVFTALATLAYDRRRADFFRQQFFAALEILDGGFPSYQKMKSSWAGAMGQSQFLPSSYLDYAVDQDGDGRVDIWDSEADVFGSIANYLAAHGWDDSITWGRRVRLPAGEEASLLAAEANTVAAPANCRRYSRIGPWRDLQNWQAMGLRRSDGSDLPARSLPAALLLADPEDGEGYLVYSNFCAIMAFNPAQKYALSIGLLSERIAE